MNVGELDEVKNDPQAAAALKASHPRLDALQDQYGPMAGAIAPASTGTAMSNSMIEVRLVCVAPSAGKKMGQQTKKVPGEIMADHTAEGHSDQQLTAPFHVFHVSVVHAAIEQMNACRLFGGGQAEVAVSAPVQGASSAASAVSEGWWGESYARQHWGG